MAKKKISIAAIRRDLVWVWNKGPNGEKCSPWLKSVAKDAYDTIGRLQRELRAAKRAASPEGR